MRVSILNYWEFRLKQTNLQLHLLHTLSKIVFYIRSDSKVYYLQEVEDERYELIFGDGIFGKKLEEGNYITVNYIATNGDAGNGISNFAFNGRLTYTRDGNEYTIGSGISLLTTEFGSRGGSSIESVDSIRSMRQEFMLLRIEQLPQMTMKH